MRSKTRVRSSYTFDVIYKYIYTQYITLCMKMLINTVVRESRRTVKRAWILCPENNNKNKKTLIKYASVYG